MELDLARCTEQEIIARKDEYSNRLTGLMERISGYIETSDPELGYRAREEYKELKTEIKEEASFFKAKRNSIIHVSKAHEAYQHGVLEASACGFSVSTSSKVDQKMHYAVEEARYRLRKYF